MNAAIALVDVTLRLGGTTVLSKLSLEVQPGEVVVLMGPSGCGKTSLLRTLLGLVVPQHGTVLLHGAAANADGRLLQVPEERRLAAVFQDLALWPHLTVREQLAFGLASQGLPRPERERRIHRMLERVGLEGKGQRYPGELSGGERQRVAIARALVLEPHGVLVDEPLANLDVVSKRELCTMIRELLREHRTAAIYVTHDLGEAIELGARVVVLESGRVAQSGTIEDLRQAPATPFVSALMASR
jgi:ABC-type Fe3+/spermidine/putrescine transport system ATPase subunit